MSLLIQKAGILTTVQDLGRVGFRRYGINPGGPMDPFAARVANLLLGNGEGAGFLEIHFPGPEIAFERDIYFTLCGGDLGATLNGAPVDTWRVARAAAGATLRFTQKHVGERTYLAVSAGIDVPAWLGSRSTNLAANIGGHEGRALMPGDRLPTGNSSHLRLTKLHAVAPSFLPRYSRFPTVRVIAGGELGLLDSHGRSAFFGQNFGMTAQSNRMGFRLLGDPLRPACPIQIVSSATTFGTIQLLPDGQLILLMADQQTAGGYPRLANVISYDLPLVGQLGPGDKLAFHAVEVAEAERLALKLEKELSFLGAACKLATR